MVAVLPREMEPLEAGKTYVKVITSCLDAENAIGVYTAGTVLEPEFYRKGAAAMERGELPLLNWLHFGVYQNAHGSNGYTIGMDAFGKDELEVLGSQRTPEEVRAFLIDVAGYVLETDAVLKNGRYHRICCQAEAFLQARRRRSSGRSQHSNCLLSAYQYWQQMRNQDGAFYRLKLRISFLFEFVQKIDIKGKL